MSQRVSSVYRRINSLRTFLRHINSFLEMCQTIYTNAGAFFCELNLLLSLYKPEIWQMLSCKINYYTQNALHNCETHFVMQQCIKSYCIAIYFAHMCSEGSTTHTETLGFNKRLIVWKEKCVCFSFLLLFSCLNVKHVVRWIPLETIWLKLKVKRLFERQESAKESGNVVQI